MEIHVKTVYDQKALTAMARGLRKTVRRKRSRRSHIVGWVLVVLALLAVGLFMGRKLDRRAFFTMAVVLAIGVPFFLPHMHERYFFLADMLTLCWACTDRKRIPVCGLAAGSSLACYIVYLRLKYSVIISVGGQRFVMAVEAAMMLAALVLSIIELVRQLNAVKENDLTGE